MWDTARRDGGDAALCVKLGSTFNEDIPYVCNLSLRMNLTDQFKVEDMLKVCQICYEIDTQGKDLTQIVQAHVRAIIRHREWAEDVEVNCDCCVQAEFRAG